ncbi:RluA family pseudouridine synthase [Phaeocystidibacter marisrubri]|uniref:RNA pseudouridine synthase n=1 Tax=Phaeocystidibacter marisrubri TaxID=1577780 RepID=A0A6L3ZKI1_9FLAO|nr:RluA family pseudouridine synthase [Phaeocystidibacter marisrubri]KAB2817965.1 RNA pseudouridine synthase [Phaeocystidibacter marisrubri]
MSHYFRKFEKSVEGIELPEQFTFPFYYKPHPLVQLAVEQLQADLSSRELNHNFGLDTNAAGTAIGKMFGVLVVKSQSGELGFLAAFSGKMADSNHHKGFVPPVYDMLDASGYFKTGEKSIHELTVKLEKLENSPELAEARKFLRTQVEKAEEDIERLKREIKEGKARRKQRRKEAEQTLAEDEFTTLVQELSEESMVEQYTLKDAKRYWEYKRTEAQANLNKYTAEIEAIKEQRREKSALLQQRLFSDYTFLNAKLESRSLLSIFEEKEQVPVAGAGECSAPKLLHYAFANGFTPIAMGEFWWGASPKSEVRNHKQFYPACRSKCEPILGHMLRGLDVEENPMLKTPENILDIEIVYEDTYLVVVNKPADFLSVPGKSVYDSVYTRMEARYPQATGPLLVHRLDMSTSGLLLVAKTKKVHKKLQSQFLKRTISKRYEALLEGTLSRDSGEIELPLRVDLDNRPQQLVCYEHGKPALTRWEKVREENGRTRVHFYPITGRTHQLRVHAAHVKGLNTPIVGDDLYGKHDKRLHLHAAYLKFVHPITDEVIELHVPSGF